MTMISAISSLISSYSSSSSQSNSTQDSSVSDLQMLLAAKKSEISNTKDEAKKKSLEAELKTLESSLATAKSKEVLNLMGSSHSAYSEFSGESDRIGSGNFDENTPFGQRIAYM
jgi:hypothetical protein